MRRSYTILYVDDDKDDLSVISDAFEKYTQHLKISHAHNGFEAMQVLKLMKTNSSLPCLIILDINMPVMDGKQTLMEIKNNPDYKNIPVVIFSTSDKPADRKFAKDLGADYITKPTKYLEMEALVAEFVQKCLIEEKV